MSRTLITNSLAGNLILVSVIVLCLATFFVSSVQNWVMETGHGDTVDPPGHSFCSCFRHKENQYNSYYSLSGLRANLNQLSEKIEWRWRLWFKNTDDLVSGNGVRGGAHWASASALDSASGSAGLPWSPEHVRKARTTVSIQPRGQASLSRIWSRSRWFRKRPMSVPLCAPLCIIHFWDQNITMINLL